MLRGVMGLRGPGARPNPKAKENYRPPPPPAAPKPPRHQGVGSAEAIYKLRCRRRRKAGLAMLRVETNYYKFIEALLQASKAAREKGGTDYITEEAALDKAKVAQAAAVVLNDFIAKWPPED